MEEKALAMQKKRLTEFELITRLTEGAPKEGNDLTQGVGDDCAVIAGPGGHDWLITTDALVEGVHFNLKWTDLKTLGRKALSVNLSDIAAMGGVPRFYIVSVGLPPDNPFGIAEPIYKGMREIAGEHELILAGGDTVASPSGILISITAIGEVKHGGCLYRSGARPADAIFMTGTAGGSALGLACLRAGFRGNAAVPFISRHLDPMARVAWGRQIAGTGMATSMIDISDGLLADLGHIADESGVGYKIEGSAVPREVGFDHLVAEIGCDPLKLVLTGGEDYELLFTVAADRVGEFERIAARSARFRISRIGTISDDISTRTVRDSAGSAIELVTTGHDHFRDVGH